MDEKIKAICSMPRMYYLSAEQANNNCFGLYDMMKEISKPDFVMVEIGSFAGISSMLFASMCKKVYCVDLWQEYSELNNDKLSEAERLFDHHNRIYPNIAKMKCDSVKAAENFKDKSLDMVYVDGAHDLKSVEEDLIAWIPKIKRGGWICGHDIKIDVRLAVEKVIGTNYKTYNDESWAKQL